MLNCPACGTPVERREQACSCGADLRLLRDLDGLADAWLNRGLAVLGKQGAGKALEWVSASCVARPTDAQARRIQAKLWAQLGKWDEALEALACASALDGDAQESEELRKAILERGGSERRGAAKGRFPASMAPPSGRGVRQARCKAIRPKRKPAKRNARKDR